MYGITQPEFLNIAGMVFVVQETHLDHSNDSGSMSSLERLGEHDLSLARSSRAGRTAASYVASALASINRAVVDALYHIVRDGFLGRLLDWATGHQVGGSAITFSLHPRSSRIPTLARHAMPVAHACFSTIDISDYRTWQEMYQHLIQVLQQSRFLFGRP